MFKNFGVVFLLCIISFSSCKKRKLNASNNVEVQQTNDLGFPNIGEAEFESLGKATKDTSIKTTIEHFYKYFWEGNDLWGDFLVAQGNEILYENYRGYSNYADSAKITAHTPIHLASISKNLTAMVVLKLVEKNKLKLDQKVNTILTKFPYPDITIFDLLTHRSGLGNYDHYAEEFHYVEPDSADFTNEKMYDMFSKCEPSLLFKPNSQHSYSNTNYAFLALVIENITKMKYPEAMKKLLFEPLQMNDTYVFTKDKMATATLSYYYNRRPWKWDKFDLIYGDKNIYSTARDLFKYSQAMFTPQFMRKSLLDSAMMGYSYERYGVKNYGLGFRLREFENGKKIVFHTGKWHGNNTLFMHMPDEKLTIITLGNRQSRANYAAFSLVSLFGDYPLELEGEDELLQVTDTEDQEKIDSLKKAAELKWKETKKEKPNSQEAESLRLRQIRIERENRITDSLNKAQLKPKVQLKPKDNSKPAPKAKDSVKPNRVWQP